MAGAGLVGYGVAEAKRYGVREYSVPVMPEGGRPIRVLVVSDFHLRLTNQSLRRFLESLWRETYDVVLATGDFIGGAQSIEECVRLLNGLTARYGRYFVFGSSDYFAPTFKNYFDYFLKIKRHGTRRNPIDRLREGLARQGWKDLTNRNLAGRWDGKPVQITGLDDPYLGWDDKSLLVRDPEAKLAICVVHDPAPYLQAIQAGYDLVVSGHTHGGQVRMPLVGAVVTNSSLPTRFARGLSRIDDGWLFVTPGLGVSKFAPFRFMCPPEASVLNLLPKTSSNRSTAPDPSGRAG